jgi:argininosuccinate lyase
LGQDKELHELTLKELRAFSKVFAEDVFEVLSPLQMINRRLSAGGTARKNVVRAIQKAKKVISREAAESQGDGKTKGASR